MVTEIGLWRRFCARSNFLGPCPCYLSSRLVLSSAKQQISLDDRDASVYHYLHYIDDYLLTTRNIGHPLDNTRVLMPILLVI